MTDDDMLDVSLDEKINIIFNTINDLCCEDKFDVVDNIIKHLIVESQETAILIGYASITFCCKSKLENRKEFMSKIRDVIQKRYPDRVDSLLVGLEKE